MNLSVPPGCRQNWSITLKNNFYRAFEERWRGSRESIKERQNIYLPFIEPLHNHYPDGMVFDIGCGRGEWLELMRDHSIPAKGIDLDEGMLEAGLSLGLDMQKGDGIDFLRNTADESAIAITSFHVVEHISFDQLQDLVSEAHRVLKPGGILILETPNPENIRVACETFYLDPTHTKPIPSGLLSFVTEYYGYKRSKVMRLQELDFLQVQKYANIAHLIENVSPDYAIVAQKKAKKEVLSLVNVPYSREYGISLAQLIEKFERRMIHFEKKVAQAEEFAWKAEIHAEQTSQHYQMVVNSYSWKLSSPLRLAAKILRKTKKVSIDTARQLPYRTKALLDKSPKLNKLLLKILNRFPKLKQKLKLLLHKKIEDGSSIEPPKVIFPDSKTITSDIMKAIERKRGKK